MSGQSDPFFEPASLLTKIDRPRGEWDRVAELMMLKFGESGHPVFRSTSPLSRGVLKSKGGGKITIISFNQLSIYGAVSDLCDEEGLLSKNGETCCVRTI